MFRNVSAPHARTSEHETRWFCKSKSPKLALVLEFVHQNYTPWDTNKARLPTAHEKVYTRVQKCPKSNAPSDSSIRNCQSVATKGITSYEWQRGHLCSHTRRPQGRSVQCYRLQPARAMDRMPTHAEENKLWAGSKQIPSYHRHAQRNLQNTPSASPVDFHHWAMSDKRCTKLDK